MCPAFVSGWGNANLSLLAHTCQSAATTRIASPPPKGQDHRNDGENQAKGFVSLIHGMIIKG